MSPFFFIQNRHRAFQVLSVLAEGSLDLVSADDLSRVDAAFFTMNGYVSVLFFVFWAADIYFFGVKA